MSLLNTRMQNLRDKAPLDLFEIRGSKYGAIQAFKAQTNDEGSFVTEELTKKAWESIGRTLQIPVIKDEDVTIGNQRTLTIQDHPNSSEMVDISFGTYTFDISQTPAEFHNNEIEMQRDWEAKYKRNLFKLMSKLDQVALANLATNKTQVLNDKLLYDFSKKVVSAKFDQREQMFGDLDVMMEANDYFGNLDLIGSPGVWSIYKQIQQFGADNMQNKGNLFGDKRTFATNNIVSNPEFYAQGYAVQRNSLGLLFRSEREGLTETVTPDGHRWELVTLPGLEIPCIAYSYVGVENKTTLGGAATADMDRVVTHYYQFAIDIAFLNAYISNQTARPTPIMGFNVLSKDAAYGLPVNVVRTATAPAPGA